MVLIRDHPGKCNWRFHLNLKVVGTVLIEVNQENEQPRLHPVGGSVPGEDEGGSPVSPPINVDNVHLLMTSFCRGDLATFAVQHHIPVRGFATHKIRPTLTDLVSVVVEAQVIACPLHKSGCP